MAPKNNKSGSNYQSQEHQYREKALKLFPWVCGRCSREFTYSNLRELTVHHIDHNHSNNPSDGSNWELLCLYCHDYEHSRFTENDLYGDLEKPGEKKREPATFQPFANLQELLDKKNSSKPD